ncbi:hypothetical protein UFOVP223_14 [uncultured Caudovirales phage]|uniref:Uncharacterized protein n=1 Tax=uncultured Caudovirales phage TaxID=2100421 RepID=A0A6J7WQ78_9CAUD|nr:hypothetical protein UFOVP110_16 [uncultured Caudovirales phage]CAB5218968.1 hypothetical protein UFOVP223_14 [uncultured Caudovirales phage]
MDDGDGAFTLELQAFKIAQNATMYKGSHPCPQCGIVMNPVEYMYSILCPECTDKRRASRVKGKMA